MNCAAAGWGCYNRPKDVGVDMGSLKSRSEGETEDLGTLKSPPSVSHSADFNFLRCGSG